MMDYDKLIEQLNARGLGNGSSLGYHCGLFDEASTALEASWRENQALRGLINGLDAELSHVRADLARVTAERNAAVNWAQKYTESIDMPCVACKHNTGDYVCTAICGNCGPMGAESCKWEFDFSGELKED